MAYTTQTMKGKSSNLFTGPKFMYVVHDVEEQNQSLIIPHRFLNEVGRIIPPNVTLQFPNGRQINVNYNEENQSLNQLDMLCKEFGGDEGFVMILSYMENGKFWVNVLEKEGAEIQYRHLRNKVSGPVEKQDKDGAIGWKFMSYVIGPIFLNGETKIPINFMERFRKIIPASITFCLKNGETLDGIYSRREGKVYGLLPIVQKGYATKWDVLIFTYTGNGRFDIGIFDMSRTEKYLGIQLEDIEADPEEQIETQEPSNEHVLVVVDVEVQDVPIQFSMNMAVSNVNNSSHGVYIPKYVKPRHRTWLAGEEVTLIRGNRTWTMGLVLSNGLARFSAGWNRFARENRLRENDVVTFRMVNDDDNGIVFEFELIENIG